MRLNLALRQAVLATHVGAFAGPGGSPSGSAFGFDFWSREADSARLGVGVECVQATAMTWGNESHLRNDAQAFLAGPGVSIGGIVASLKAGKADSTMVESTPDGFSRGQRSGMTIGKVSVTYPIRVTDRLELAVSASRHALLETGSKPAWQRQVFLATKETGRPGSLALTDDDPGSRRDPYRSTAQPGDFLDRAMTVGFSLLFRFPSN